MATSTTLQDRRGPEPELPRLLGERLPLDFANSAEPRLAPIEVEYIGSYADLARWGHHLGLLTSEERDALIERGEHRPDEAAGVYQRAMELREAIYRTFAAIANGQPPGAADLATIHAEHVAALSRTQLVSEEASVRLAWPDDPAALDRMLWPVAQDAIALLLEGDPARIKQCPGADGRCGWLYYDSSKNRSRHWCSMEGCGSAAKMRRYRARKRTTRT